MTVLFWFLLDVATLLTCLATLAGFLGRRWWMLELASHFRLQYFALLALSSSLYFVRGSFLIGALAILFASLNLRLLLPYYAKRQAAEPKEKIYRAVVANILRKNRSYDRVLRIIHETNPDIIVLIEVSQAWMQALKDLRTEYPFVESAPRPDDYGIAVFSRVPISASAVHDFGDLDRPTIIARLDLDGHTVTLVSPHPAPPKSKREAEDRNRQLCEIGQYVAQKSGPKLLMADLNITPWSPYFQDLLDRSGLREGRIGFGLQPTWPTTIPLLYIPIDHVLVSPEINVHRHKLGPRLGSDHLPLVVDFSINRQ